MQAQELAEMREEGSKTKFKSRTFWLTIVWVAMVPLGIIAQIILASLEAGTVEIPIGQIVTFAGSATLVYIGGNKAITAVESSKLNN